MGTAYCGELCSIGMLAAILSSNSGESCAAKFLEALCMLVFEASALAEKAGEVLGSIREQDGEMAGVTRTRAEAMLCFRRFSRTLIPI